MNKENYSLGQKVFQRIREDILAGNYKAGEELKEVAIGQELGVSRTPVREALRQLELEGLVNIISNKGTYVIGFTVKDFQDIYEIRFALEGLCARRAAVLAGEGQIEALEEIQYLTEFHLKKGHLEQVVKLDERFHQLLYQAAGSRILERELCNYHHYLERVRRASLSYAGRADRAGREHRHILEAIKTQDAKKAEYAVNQHLANTIENIESYGWESITGGQENGKN